MKASNSAGSDTKLFTLIVPFSEIRHPKITTTELAEGFVNSPYGQKLTATGTSTGLTSLTWSADGLPDGLTLSTAGYLSGIPTSEGTAAVTVYAANAIGTDSADFTLTVSEPPANTKPTITTEPLHPAAVGLDYYCQLTATVTPPFKWTYKGKLPQGFTMTEDGLITGNTSKKLAKVITVTVSNNFGTDTKKFTLKSYKLPQITRQYLKDATVGKPYSKSITKKGTPPFTWELEGKLPEGISFKEKNGKITGQHVINDSGMIRITLTNPVGELSKVYILKVNAILPKIKPSKLPTGTYGKKYNAAFNTNKATKPITFILEGNLPAGLSFDSATLKITGTPSEVSKDVPLKVIAYNMGGVVSKDYTLTVKATNPKITTKKLPDGVAGSAYSVTLEATGTPQLTWTAS